MNVVGELLERSLRVESGELLVLHSLAESVENGIDSGSASGSRTLTLLLSAVTSSAVLLTLTLAIGLLALRSAVGYESQEC